MAMNIFLIKLYGKAGKYGVGSYIATLKRFLAGCPGINAYVVHLIADTRYGVECVANATCRDIFIRFDMRAKNLPVMSEFCIDELQARAIYGILHEFMPEKDVNILHLNNVLETWLAEVAGEYSHCAVFYTMHVLLWQVFYKNNFGNFEGAWESKEANKYVFSIQEEMRLCALSDNLICLTEDAVNFSKTYYGVDPSKIKLVHNVINVENISMLPDRERECLRRKLGFGLQEVIIIFSGRLMYEKGLTFAIEALNRLHNKNYDFHFLICGDGDFSGFADKCRDFIGKISYAGFVDRKKLYEFYQIADIGLLPSFIEQNSFSALEMLAHGLAVIVSDTDAFSQFKCFEKSIIQIPVNSDVNLQYINIDLLEIRLSELINDAGYRRHIGQNAERMIRECFTPDNLDIEDIYGPYVPDNSKTDLAI